MYQVIEIPKRGKHSMSKDLIALSFLFLDFFFIDINLVKGNFFYAESITNRIYDKNERLENSTFLFS